MIRSLGGKPGPLWKIMSVVGTAHVVLESRDNCASPVWSLKATIYQGLYQSAETSRDAIAGCLFKITTSLF